MMRKRTLLTALLAVATTLLTASTANALVTYDGATEEPCPAVSVSGNTVTGGCLIEDFEGSLDVYSGGGILFVTGDVTFDVRIGPNPANAYIINQTTNLGPWVRFACVDETNSQVVPWARTPGTPQFGICLENTVAGAGFTQPVPFAFTQGSQPNTLGGMTQTNTPTDGIRNAQFTNQGDTDTEIYFE